MLVRAELQVGIWYGTGKHGGRFPACPNKATLLIVLEDLDSMIDDKNRSFLSERA